VDALGERRDGLSNFPALPAAGHGSKAILAAHPCFHLFFGCPTQEKPRSLVQLPSTRSSGTANRNP